MKSTRMAKTAAAVTLAGVLAVGASSVSSGWKVVPQVATSGTPLSRQKPSAFSRVRVCPTTKRMSSLLPCTEVTSERPQRPSPTMAARSMKAC